MDTLIHQISLLIAIQQHRRLHFIDDFSDDEGIWIQRIASASFDQTRATLYAALGESNAKKIVGVRYKELMKVVFGMGQDGNHFWEWFVGWKMGGRPGIVR